MAQPIALNEPAPDFELDDFGGTAVKLSAYQNKKHVILVFNRGLL